ncbi:hypothetical protein MCOR34_005177 [Pyricularia oryzae]|nr:hypothetical protein MCOR34_005177 [Pyricularia oryzae]
METQIGVVLLLFLDYCLPKHNLSLVQSHIYLGRSDSGTWATRYETPCIENPAIGLRVLGMMPSLRGTKKIDGGAMESHSKAATVVMNVVKDFAIQTVGKETRSAREMVVDIGMN